MIPVHAAVGKNIKNAVLKKRTNLGAAFAD